ncbi:hypothetical protein GC105_08355 [Alkalibaculum sp. M08DMB]|uniref:AraC effector-binding domain-containing protein n=1 Tax=Alkalibaculum sporogenes TaxID=2655001 RepID=A0A6A7K8N0_9FIRM|nr:GyrI-like domain-containing protein [Alkalibaculum sporogenes]MPW25800.1 hypothetical protein [Alkalibaculum sporogenes]
MIKEVSECTVSAIFQTIIKELPECIVYSKRMTVPNYDSYFELIPAIGKAVSEKYPDLKCIVPEYCFIIYLDNEYKEKDIHVEYCEAIDKMKDDFEDVKFKKMEKVTAISVMHKGAYAGLAHAYAYAFKWIDENGYAVADSRPKVRPYALIMLYRRGDLWSPAV